MISVFYYFGHLLDLVLFWIVPLYLWLPWIQLSCEFQHFGNILRGSEGTRSFTFKSKWLNSFLFPMNFNLHEAHHENTLVPFYQLAEYTRALGHEVYSAAKVSCLFLRSNK
jgi:fatty acid desaturase